MNLLEIADFIKTMRAMGALQVKVAGAEVLFPPPRAESNEKRNIEQESAKPAFHPDYTWTPDQDPELLWATYKAPPPAAE